jgi:alpha-amylase/alpha-mannosidase (GH57 family)
MAKYICIHGHFYQPPRENPWLESIEIQDSAHPYHDWNERITAECYAPNATARMLDAEGRIERIVNNYSRISFNFGPTLLAWMQDKAPEVLAAIVQADKESRARFSGHGSALAQAYNHMILPLANRRDKTTQVLWGIRDFEQRFGRFPEGMWLPETAVDTESLEVLAELGIKFTLLSPYQAAKVRSLTGGDWGDVNGGRIDPTRAYQVKLPSGRTIAVFFYDGPISQGVAFERLLDDGERFAQRLLGAFSDQRDWDQLVHIATDGESYGHHHWRGEMALAAALHRIEADPSVQLTNYGEYLERHPPTLEVQIHEKSAWSCSHGVERWRSHCGCNTGGRPKWNQRWRAPLREAYDWLRDQLAPRFEQEGARLFKDPWAARDAYIEVILHRSAESTERFLAAHARGPLEADARTRALKLLEMQRHALLMYTSCGWFFDELSGIETVQTIQYAGRALQLAQEVFGEDLEPPFLDILAQAKSNVREHRDGRTIFNKFVKPAMMDMEKLGAHYGVSSLFEDYPEQVRIYAYSFQREHYQRFTAGRSRLAVGRAKVTSEITGESAVFSFGVLHLGDHNLNGGVRLYRGEAAYAQMQRDLVEAFHKADFPETIRVMDRHFGESNYSLKSLFRDEQRRILGQILDATLADLESRFRAITDRYTPLTRFLASLWVPAPEVLRHASHFVLNADLRRQFESEHLDFDRVRQLLEESEASQVALDTETLGYTLKGTIDRLMERCVGAPDDVAALQRLTAFARMARELPFEVNLWKTQNLYFALRHATLPQYRERAAAGDTQAETWLNAFTALGDALGFQTSA